MFIKDDLKNGISFIKNHFDTLIWLKFDKLFFNLENDVFVCAVYMWSGESPAARVYGIAMFNVVENDILTFEMLGSVFVAGDVNARDGNKPDCIVYETLIETIDTNELPRRPHKISYIMRTWRFSVIHK